MAKIIFVVLLCVPSSISYKSPNLDMQIISTHYSNVINGRDTSLNLIIDIINYYQCFIMIRGCFFLPVMYDDYLLPHNLTDDENFLKNDLFQILAQAFGE